MTVNLNAYSIAGLINKLLSNQLMTAKDTGHHKNQNDILNSKQISRIPIVNKTTTRNKFTYDQQCNYFFHTRELS